MIILRLILAGLVILGTIALILLFPGVIAYEIIRQH